MKYFRIIREFDVSNVSGTGHVLDGVVFDDGTTVVRWKSATASTAIYASFEDFKAIHIDAHPENKTIIQMRSTLPWTYHNEELWELEY